MANQERNQLLWSLADALAELTCWREQRRRVGRSLSHCGRAVKSAREYGITRTMQVLNLEFYALTRRMQERAPVVKSEPAFVEFPALASRPRSSCTIELRAEGGRTLCVELDGLNVKEFATSGLGRVPPRSP